MKLFYKVFLRLSLGLVPVLAVWAFVFHYAMMDEVTDEIDDSLEDYSEMIITRSLAGEELPSDDSGSNNQYFLRNVSREYSLSHPHISYKDTMVYIAGKRETEPARVLTTIFRNGNDEYFLLEVSVPTIERADLAESVLWMLVWLYAALLLTFLLVNFVVFKRSMKPLYSLLAWLGNNRLGNRREELDIPADTEEFRKLFESVREYSNHSERVFMQQKQFIGNASHEIQTPIAVSINRLEMLMEDETLSQRQMEELCKTIGTLESVSKLNRTLLVLSKIENHQYDTVREVSFSPLAEKYLEDFGEIYAGKGITAEVKVEGEFSAQINENLADMLIANLLKNAFVHNVPGGVLKVLVRKNGFEVGNTAEGEAALDSSNIFSRFWHGPGKEDSTGLGLSIVEAVCRESNLDISYRFSEGMHWFVVGK